MKVLASILQITVGELKNQVKNRSNILGIAQSYLEAKLESLAAKKDWTTFMDVLALTIYGVVLFPRMDGYIDFSAINVFLAWKNGKENPTSAVLADTYYTLHFSHENKGRKIYCCLPVLYVWLVTHVFSNQCKLTCPIEDYNMCYVKNKSDKEWAKCLADLSERAVRWYPSWNKLTEVIYQCGNFPNLPLIGTRGCINCNPCLALRQLGYPMMGPPTNEMTIPFYEKDLENIESMKAVCHAWNRVMLKG